MMNKYSKKGFSIVFIIALLFLFNLLGVSATTSIELVKTGSPPPRIYYSLSQAKEVPGMLQSDQKEWEISLYYDKYYTEAVAINRLTKNPSDKWPKEISMAGVSKPFNSVTLNDCSFTGMHLNTYSSTGISNDRTVCILTKEGHMYKIGAPILDVEKVIVKIERLSTNSLSISDLGHPTGVCVDRDDNLIYPKFRKDLVFIVENDETSLNDAYVRDGDVCLNDIILLEKYCNPYGISTNQIAEERISCEIRCEDGTCVYSDPNNFPKPRYTSDEGKVINLKVFGLGAWHGFDFDTEELITDFDEIMNSRFSFNKQNAGFSDREYLISTKIKDGEIVKIDKSFEEVSFDDCRIKLDSINGGGALIPDEGVVCIALHKPGTNGKIRKIIKMSATQDDYWVYLRWDATDYEDISSVNLNLISCSESDSGFDLLNPGTIEYDSDDGQKIREEDSCVDIFAIKELYCEEGNKKESIYSCDFFCDKGKCVYENIGSIYMTKDGLILEKASPIADYYYDIDNRDLYGRESDNGRSEIKIEKRNRIHPSRYDVRIVPLRDVKIGKVDTEIDQTSLSSCKKTLNNNNPSSLERIFWTPGEYPTVCVEYDSKIYKIGISSEEADKFNIEVSLVSETSVPSATLEKTDIITLIQNQPQEVLGKNLILDPADFYNSGGKFKVKVDGEVLDFSGHIGEVKSISDIHIKVKNVNVNDDGKLFLEAEITSTAPIEDTSTIPLTTTPKSLFTNKVVAESDSIVLLDPHHMQDYVFDNEAISVISKDYIKDSKFTVVYGGSLFEFTDAGQSKRIEDVQIKVLDIFYPQGSVQIGDRLYTEEKDGNLGLAFRLKVDKLEEPIQTVITGIEEEPVLVTVEEDLALSLDDLGIDVKVITDISEAPKFVDAYEILVEDAYSSFGKAKRKEVGNTAVKLALYGQEKLNKRSLAKLLTTTYEKEDGLFFIRKQNEISDALVSAMGELIDDENFFKLAELIRSKDTPDELKTKVKIALSGYGSSGTQVIEDADNEDLCLNFDSSTGIYELENPVIWDDRISIIFKTKVKDIDLKIRKKGPGTFYRQSYILDLKSEDGDDHKKINVTLKRDIDDELYEGYLIELNPNLFVGYGGEVYDKIPSPNDFMPFVGPTICAHNYEKNKIYFTHYKEGVEGDVLNARFSSGVETKTIPLTRVISKEGDFEIKTDLFKMAKPVYISPEGCLKCTGPEYIRTKEVDSVQVSIGSRLIMSIERKSDESPLSDLAKLYQLKKAQLLGVEPEDVNVPDSLTKDDPKKDVISDVLGGRVLGNAIKWFK